MAATARPIWRNIILEDAIGTGNSRVRFGATLIPPRESYYNTPDVCYSALVSRNFVINVRRVWASRTRKIVLVLRSAICRSFGSSHDARALLPISFFLPRPDFRSPRARSAAAPSAGLKGYSGYEPDRLGGTAAGKYQPSEIGARIMRRVAQPVSKADHPGYLASLMRSFIFRRALLVSYRIRDAPGILGRSAESIRRCSTNTWKIYKNASWKSVIYRDLARRRAVYDGNTISDVLFSYVADFTRPSARSSSHEIFHSLDRAWIVDSLHCEIQSGICLFFAIFVITRRARGER